tara:strand:- start:6804 stop:8333 length:1530 start_codon:yes stop_codon:yes gene_type:complete
MAEKESSFLTDRSFGGRFKRALAVALPSIALAKDNPYLVKSLYDKEEEFGKLDRAENNELVKSVVSNISGIITKNRTKRESRIDSNLESLTKIKNLFKNDNLDNADIAFIHDRGLSKTFNDIKNEYSLSSIKPLVENMKSQSDTSSEDPNTTKIPNMTLKELATAMAPAAKRFDMEMMNLRTAPASGPITSFVSGEMFADESEKGVDITPRVQNILKTSDVKLAEDDEKTKEIKSYLDSQDVMLSELGKEAQRLSELTSTDKLPEKKMESEMAKKVGAVLGVTVDVDEVNNTVKFLTTNIKLKKAMPIIVQELTAQAKKLKLDMAKKQDDPRLLTNLDSINSIFKQNTTLTDDGFDIAKPGSYLFEELKKRGLVTDKGDIVKDPQKKDKDKDKDSGAPKVGEPKKPKTFDELLKDLKGTTTASTLGKKTILQMLKIERQKYIDRIKKLDANNQANVAEIFRRRYSNEGFLEIVKDKLKQNNISMGPATIDYFKNILINDPAFANPYATN